MPPSDSEQSRWFANEVQPHEPDLRAYLRARFPQLTDIDDVVQETYRRLWREWSAGRVRETRPFMFAAARNIALDLFRHRQVVRENGVTHLDAPDVVQEAPDVAEVLNHQQELEFVAEAIRALPDRCREVIMLRHFKGCSYKEIAALLGVSTETVKTQLARGLERCAAFLEARGLFRERDSLRSKFEKHERG